MWKRDEFYRRKNKDLRAFKGGGGVGWRVGEEEGTSVKVSGKRRYSRCSLKDG